MSVAERPERARDLQDVSPMKRRTFTAILLAAAGHGLAHAASLPAEVLGTWALSEAAADLVAPNCRSASYRFDATTVTLTDGQMLLKPRYDLAGERRQGDGALLTLRQVVVEHNARPDCRGALFSVVPGQRIHDLRIEAQGDRLRLHLPERRGGSRHVDLVRSTRWPVTSATSSGPAMPTVSVVHVADPTAAKPRCPDLAYPEAALREQAQGTTRIRFVIDASGKATQPLITHGAGMTRGHRVLDRAATESLVKCQFPVDEPARERSSVIDYVWRLPDADRLPGQ
jgi:TonB family protein